MREGAQRGSALTPMNQAAVTAAEQVEDHGDEHGLPGGLLQALVGQAGEETRSCCGGGRGWTDRAAVRDIQYGRRMLGLAK